MVLPLGIFSCLSPCMLIFVFTASSPGLEPRQTPEGWGSLCQPQGQELQCSVHCGSVGETGLGWLYGEGSCPPENQFPVIPWR